MVMPWGTCRAAPLGWEMREGYTREVVFELGSKEPAKGAAPMEAELSLACLWNRKASVAAEKERREVGGW